MDDDWVGNADDKNSTSEGCFHVGGNLVVWMSKNQDTIFLSTIESEYIAHGSCYTQILWMKKMLQDYGFS